MPIDDDNKEVGNSRFLTIKGVFEAPGITMTVQHETPVLIVGAGPSGLLLAHHMAKKGIRSMLIERNLDTTKWPKMDITNCRSMELFRRMGVAQGLRDQGVPQHYSFDVLFSTGLSDGGELIAKWDLPSPDVWRQRISNQNDGSMPREPYQRCSQAIFEAWLKQQVEAEPLIDSHFGWKLESYQEANDRVVSSIVNVGSGENRTVVSQYVAGCDGSGSRVRKQLGIGLIGGPTPAAMYLVHFKSQDLTALQKQGQFWHIFFTNGGVIISQDEVDTWTIHLPISLDTDWKSLDPEESIYKVLGGSIGPYRIMVDEILVCSAWRPNIAIAERFASESLRIFLVGDAAHQNIPTGGYGMNTAVGDSFDLGWKLSAVLNGWGSRNLLQSYGIERKPVGVRNIERSGQHFQVHRDYVGWVAEAAPGVFLQQSECKGNLLGRIRAHVESNQGENKDHGIEMGYQYNGSPIVVGAEDEVDQEPQWNYQTYIPSTWPGVRAPHVYLNDGKTSIYDLFGPEYTIFDFTKEGKWAAGFDAISTQLVIPLKSVHLPGEDYARGIWGRDAVLIRPDDHVAWRLPATEKAVDIATVLKIATGQHVQEMNEGAEAGLNRVKEHGFTSTIGNVEPEKVKLLAQFQQ